MICFQISIFEPLETTTTIMSPRNIPLWFAFKLVSLNHWKQPHEIIFRIVCVVICFQISIFEPLETTPCFSPGMLKVLWFAFKLVSLNHWKQHNGRRNFINRVVICFQISIFEPLETTYGENIQSWYRLWFAFKLVSLNHWKQLSSQIRSLLSSCDLLSN